MKGAEAAKRTYHLQGPLERRKEGMTAKSSEAAPTTAAYLVCAAWTHSRECAQRLAIPHRCGSTRDHAQIALRQIVFKIHAEDCQEEQNRPLVFAQPIQQIAGGTLFAAHADAADLLQ